MRCQKKERRSDACERRGEACETRDWGGCWGPGGVVTNVCNSYDSQPAPPESPGPWQRGPGDAWRILSHGAPPRTAHGAGPAACSGPAWYRRQVSIFLCGRRVCARKHRNGETPRSRHLAGALLEGQTGLRRPPQNPDVCIEMRSLVCTILGRVRAAAHVDDMLRAVAVAPGLPAQLQSLRKFRPGGALLQAPTGGEDDPARRAVRRRHSPAVRHMRIRLRRALNSFFDADTGGEPPPVPGQAARVAGAGPLNGEGAGRRSSGSPACCSGRRALGPSSRRLSTICLALLPQGMWADAEVPGMSSEGLSDFSEVLDQVRPAGRPLPL